jgi:rare lipoprotein A
MAADMGSIRAFCVVGVLACVAACSSPAQDDAPAAVAPPQSAPAPERPARSIGTTGSTARVQNGVASYMSDRLDGRKTASGVRYDKDDLVAAHPTLPLGTRVRVTNQENGRTVDVEIVDRSAAGASRPIIDLSRAAARRLDFIKAGKVKVSVEVVER